MRPIRDYPPDDYDAVIDGPSRIARLRRAFSTGTGAVVAMALLVALGVWVYRLGVRDAESVPIIRASAEPTKTRPEEPGGVVTPYQDITSYRVAESKAGPPATTVLAPPPPEPRPEDVAMGMLAPEPAKRPGARPAEQRAPAARPADVVRPTGGQRAAAAAPSSDEAEVEPEEGTDAVVVEEGAGPSESSDPPTEADEIAALVREATLDAATEAKPEPAVVTDGAGGSNIPLPPARPSDLLARVHDAARAAEQSAAERKRLAAASPVQIQLAADPDEQVVRTIWRRISQANPDILHDRELAVQSTVSGGRTYYRLRVGPSPARPRRMRSARRWRRAGRTASSRGTADERARRSTASRDTS